MSKAQGDGAIGFDWPVNFSLEKGSPRRSEKRVTSVRLLSGQGGGNHSAEFIKIIPLWVLVDYVG